MSDCLQVVITNLFVYFSGQQRIIERYTFKDLTCQAVYQHG